MSVRALIFCQPNCVMTENRSYLFISSTCATQSSLARSAHPLKNLKFKLSFLIILFLPDENLIVGRDMFDPLFLDFRIILKPIIKACVIKELPFWIWEICRFDFFWHCSILCIHRPKSYRNLWVVQITCVGIYSFAKVPAWWDFCKVCRRRRLLWKSFFDGNDSIHSNSIQNWKELD